MGFSLLGVTGGVLAYYQRKLSQHMSSQMATKTTIKVVDENKKKRKKQKKEKKENKENKEKKNMDMGYSSNFSSSSNGYMSGSCSFEEDGDENNIVEMKTKSPKKKKNMKNQNNNNANNNIYTQPSLKINVKRISRHHTKAQILKSTSIIVGVLTSVGLLIAIVFLLLFSTNLLATQNEFICVYYTLRAGKK